MAHPPFMDLPRNLHDCYFFYYSTCKKGTSCEYRHEPAALGHEKTCKMWAEGKCYNRTCTMRHMKIQSPRSATPCFWEDQPGGCRKPHCVFQHKNARPNQPTTSNVGVPAPVQPAPAPNGAPTAHLMHSSSPAVLLDYNYTILPRII